MSKRLITIVGANGVGKTTTSNSLLQMCPNSAYVDADWCRAINPFQFTEATKKTVTDNIFCLFRNYLTLMNTDVRRIVAMIKPFSDAKNLKIATALYQLTIHSEDAYTTIAQISDKSGVSPEKVQDCLESDLSQFILEKEGPESQFRFDGIYMNILPIISLFDFK